MDSTQREFLETLLETESPSGYETPALRAWIDYVSSFADSVETDAYGNAVASFEGDSEVSIAVTGHADEIGYAVSSITEEGFLRIIPVGGSDPAVSRGTQIEIQTDEGPVNGVIAQTAIHLRDRGESGEVPEITAQHVDIGAKDGAAARELVEVGDPAIPAVGLHDLAGSRIAGRGIDNRAGLWVAAETLRRAVERDVDATVHAVATVQEELGTKGAMMVGTELDADAVVAVDVTHASDNPAYPEDQASDVSLGEGPVVTRGTANHPELVNAVREAAESADLPVQLQASGRRTGTDADAFYTQRGGTPSLNLGIPNRYMHTPVEVIDTEDLSQAAAVLTETAAQAETGADFRTSL
ncbi:M20/M25/M40 family metallo-hydrolase [Halodesulfurarchaeum formicicum]|nr:M20/M25/M40 family metallo-hydrolase [Halodesulfurarchaeum formicicum]